MNIEFLMNSNESWIKYNTMIHLLDFDREDIRVIQSQSEIMKDELVSKLIDELENWPGKIVNSHKSSGQLYHKLAFVADIGLNCENIRIQSICNKVASYKHFNGVYSLPMNVSKSYGGSGEDLMAWALCDAPLIMYSLIKMGYLNRDEYKVGLDYLINLIRPNGWPCATSVELGNFRGPGRKDDPCPYANLLMLKLLSVLDHNLYSEEILIGVETILNLWSNSLEKHPYMFFMGTDFRKLKSPFIWYDILHVVEVLSNFEFVRLDGRFLNMVELLNSKADQNHTFMCESEWRAWKGWEFAQKKVPSAWVTFLVYRINKRLSNSVPQI